VESRPRAIAPGGPVRLFVGCVSVLALTCLVVAAPGLWEALSTRPLASAGFAAVTAALQLMAVRGRSRCSISASGVALLCAGFTLGAGAAIVAALTLAFVHSVRSRPPLHRALFNGSAFLLAAAAAASLYHLLETGGSSTGAKVAWALAAVFAYWAINNGLLAVAMGLSEERNPVALWRERLFWLTPHYFVAGTVALAASVAYADFGLFAVAVLALPPAVVLLRAAGSRKPATV